MWGKLETMAEEAVEQMVSRSRGRNLQIQRLKKILIVSMGFVCGRRPERGGAGKQSHQNITRKNSRGFLLKGGNWKRRWNKLRLSP